MKALVQRVTKASVSVAGETTGEIGAGLVVLLGVAKEDDEADARYLVEKIANLRIFAEDENRFNRSALDIGADVCGKLNRRHADTSGRTGYHHRVSTFQLGDPFQGFDGCKRTPNYGRSTLGGYGIRNLRDLALTNSYVFRMEKRPFEYVGVAEDTVAFLDAFSVSFGYTGHLNTGNHRSFLQGLRHIFV